MLERRVMFMQQGSRRNYIYPRQLEEAGFDAKLTKPISAAALLAAVDGMVAGAEDASEPDSAAGSGSALDRLRGNEKLLAELQEMFAAEAAAAIDRLKSALAAGDDEVAFQTAHRLRGQLLLLGADDAAEIAEAIESESHAGRTEAAAARVADLTAAIDRIGAAAKS